MISKSAGGIGLSIHCIRATGSYIRGTNGTSNGIVPMLRVFNDTARWVWRIFTIKLFLANEGEHESCKVSGRCRRTSASHYPDRSRREIGSWH